jgi:hypothetical protein
MRTIGHEELKQITGPEGDEGTTHSAPIHWKHGEKQGHKEVSLCLIMGIH